MPDDIEEVTEPENPEETQPEEVVDAVADPAEPVEPEPGEEEEDESDEAEAFGEDDEATPVNPEEEEPEPEPEEEKGEPGLDAEEEPEDLDEDDLRGKELLEQEQEQKLEEDRKSQEEAAERQRQLQERGRAADPQAPAPIDAATAKIYHDVLPDSLIPDTVDVDGKTLDLKGYLEDFPESRVLSALAADKVVIELVKQGLLMTAKQHEQALQDAENRIYNYIFSERVQEDVPKAFDISESPEFKEWHKTAKPETQALFRSANPRDHVRGLKKYMAEQGLAEAKEKKTGKTSAARTRKTKHDDLHKTTLKSRKAGAYTLTPEDEEREAFESEED